MEAADIKVWAILFDDTKIDYIATKGVMPADVDEVHGNRPRYFVRNPARNLYNMIGPNRAGRFLVAGLQQITETQFRLVTAYWNNDGRAQRIYEDAQ